MTKSENKLELLGVAFLFFLAAWIRFYQIADLMPFIADQGKDFLAAAEFVETGQIPLLGIESSVPRFRQGPVHIWLISGIQALMGLNPIYPAFISAAIGLLTVGVVFILGQRVWSTRIGYIASLIIAFSPLAVAQSRLAFHTNPIPLISAVYLAFLIYYRKHKSNFFGLVCFWALLFQFELVVAPLALLIPYVVWRTKTKITFPLIIQGLGALALGLLPQLIYDISHNFQQLGLFAVWIGYRVFSFIKPASEHSFSLLKIGHVISRLIEYTQKFFSWWHWLPSLIIGLITCWGISKKNKELQADSVDILMLWVGIMLVSYIFMGNASEAYFPVLFVPAALLVGYGVAALKGLYHKAALSLILTVALVNIYFLINQQFLMASSERNVSNPFNTYGPPLKDQLAIMVQIKQLDMPVKLLSNDPAAAEFASYLDNYYYVAKWLDIEIDRELGVPIWINHSSNTQRHKTYSIMSGRIQAQIPIEL